KVTLASEVSDIGALLPSWELSLRARNRADRTIYSYVESVRLLENFLADAGMATDVARLTRESIETFVADQLAKWAPATASVRFKSLQQFMKWCVEEGELTANPMVNMRPPQLPEVPVPVVSDATLTPLLRVCSGKGFEDHRDTAMLRIFI